MIAAGYPPPLDSAGNLVSIVAWAPNVDDTDGTVAEFIDAPGEGFPGPSYIVIHVKGMEKSFKKSDAICDPWLLTVVIHHEYHHGGGAYPGYGGDVCGEWLTNLLTLSLICELLAEYGHLPFFPVDEFCGDACTLVGWFEDKQEEFMSNSCTGASYNIPPVCPGCDCP